MSFSIQQLIKESINQERETHKKKRESWYPTDLGKCLTGAYWARMGKEPIEFSDRQLRVFKVGTIFERFITDLIDENKNGYKVELQVPVRDEKLDLSGYADMVITTSEKRIVYEIKSIHSRAFWHMEREGGAAEHYKLQLFAYLYMLNIDEGRLLYISKDDLAISEYVVLRNNKKLEVEFLREMEILNRAWRDKKPPKPEPTIIKEGNKYKINWKAKYCSYHHHCLNDENWLEKAKKEVYQLNKVGTRKSVKNHKQETSKIKK